jgi:hypothetical protein
MSNIDFSTYASTRQARNLANGGIILCAFGYAAEPFGSGAAGLVTSRPDQGLEAGQ